MMNAGESGFTLVETLVAMVIFAISSLAMASLLTTGIRQASENNVTSQAIALAQEELEDVRTYRYVDMAPAPARTVLSAKGGIAFTITRTVINNNPALGMSRVTVTVAWNSHGAPRTYETESIFTRLANNL